MIIGLPHHHLPAALESSCLAGPEGWLKADPHTLETSCEDVYALGDVAGLTTSAGDWLPKVGFFAHYQAEVVARNLALKLSGQKPRFKFQGAPRCRHAYRPKEDPLYPSAPTPAHLQQPSLSPIPLLSS